MGEGSSQGPVTDRDVRTTHRDVSAAGYDVSIVVPVKNEQDSVPILAGEITSAFEGQGRSWECIWVDDGSTDGTLAVLKKLHEEDGRHHFAAHDRNHGQSAALFTGARLARGGIIATLDGDLQNDPSDLPGLVAALESSEYDMVNGVRSTRRDTFLRRASSRIANAFRNRMTGKTATDVGCAVRVFYRECLEGVPLFRGTHRFLPTLIAARGYRLTELPVNHRPRVHGRTSYGVHNRLWVGIADTFGVRWLLSRGVHPGVAETSLPTGHSAARQPEEDAGSDLLDGAHDGGASAPHSGRESND